MSDITGTTDQPPDGALETAAPVDVATAEAEVIPIPSDMAGLLTLLEPVLADVVKLAVKQAVETTPVPRKVPAKVTAVSVSTRVATVLVDGDTTPIQAQIIGDFPIVGGRAMVDFVPPNAVFCTSVVGGLGIPGGGVIAYYGAVSYDPITTTSSPAGAAAPPPGFLRPYGQVVTVAAYPVGFAAMGTAYNTGGETAGSQYRLPDLRGRMIVGLDNMGGTDAGRLSTANTLGTAGGAETVTLAEANLPSHVHGLNSHTHTATPSLSVSSHNHGLNSHTHSFTPTGSISGSVGSHTHDLASHTHTVNSHTHDLSNHTHTHTGWANGSTGFAAGANWFGDSQSVGSGGPSNNNSGSASPGTGGPSNNTSGSASPSFSGSFSGSGGTTGAASGNTGDASPSVTGSVSIGAASGNTTATGSGTAVNKMPPFSTANWLIRV